MARPSKSNDRRRGSSGSSAGGRGASNAKRGAPDSSGAGRGRSTQKRAGKSPTSKKSGAGGQGGGRRRSDGPVKFSRPGGGRPSGGRSGGGRRRRGGPAPGAPNTDPNAPQRLQKILAAAGFGSRRQCEELILDGRVDVDGEIITKLGTTAVWNQQKIHVDGRVVKRPRPIYFALNKPVGVVTTAHDPHGRARVIDLVPPDERVYPVGRLDKSSEGLILLTNDGELTQALTHPRFEIPKIYRVTVAGSVDRETMRTMRKGIYIAEGLVKVEGAKILKTRPRWTELEITLTEGKNREIRRILAKLGHKVQKLKRIAIGPLRLGEMPPGAHRQLTREEVSKLKAAVRAGGTKAASGPSTDDPPQRSSKRPNNAGKQKKHTEEKTTSALPQHSAALPDGKQAKQVMEQSREKCVAPIPNTEGSDTADDQQESLQPWERDGALVTEHTLSIAEETGPSSNPRSRQSNKGDKSPVADPEDVDLSDFGFRPNKPTIIGGDD
ncbi:MAG: pseudouridine synthase [Planctomycetota bacterium]